MSDPTFNKTSPEEQDESLRKTERAMTSALKRLRARIVTGLFLLALSIIGVGITDYAPKRAFTYWLIMVPLFGIICIVHAWRATKRGDRKITVGLLRRQLLHWAGLLFFVYIIWRLVNIGEVGADVAGLFTLMLLALTTYLAGVHFDWMFILIGGVLAVIAASAAIVEQYLLLWMIPIVLIAALFLLFKFRFHGKKEAS